MKVKDSLFLGSGRNTLEPNPLLEHSSCVTPASYLTLPSLSFFILEMMAVITDAYKRAPTQ
jgi:hypothetical protein